MVNPPVYVLLTTYNRTSTALKTIQAIKENLKYDNYGFMISDDGSEDPDHISQLLEEIHGFVPCYLYNGERKGVGHGMNYCMQYLWALGVNHIMMVEDDWLLTKPLYLQAYVNLLSNYPDIGMIRFGYLSAGLSGNLISAENKLWWKFSKNDYQYIYTGHASIRHKRLHDFCGLFSEGLSPGQNELDFCAKYNSTVNAPAIVWDAEYGMFGPFDHIGGTSLADITPEQ